MGWGKKFKKLTRSISKLGRIAAATATFGATEIGGHNSIGAKYQKEASRIGTQVGDLDPVEQKKEAQKAEAVQTQMQNEANQRAADNANKEFIASVNRQRESSLLGKSKTDYTGDLSDDYENAEETTNKLLSKPLVTKRRKLLGM